MKDERRFRTFDECQIELLRDPEDALGYLIISLDEFAQDGDIDELVSSLELIFKAQGLVADELQTQNLKDELLHEPSVGWGLVEKLDALFELKFDVSSIEVLPGC